MASQSSRERSPRSSAKSKTSRAAHQPAFHGEEQEQYIDRSFDHVARVRAAKEAAQRAMEEFGDLSEYDVTVIHGQLRESSDRTEHLLLDFEQGEAS